MELIETVHVSQFLLQLIRKRRYEIENFDTTSLLTSLCKKIKLKESKKCWSYPKSNSYFDEIWTEYDDDRFIKKYRVSKSTFNYICQDLKDCLGKSDTKLRKCIPIEKRVAFGLYFLKSNCDADTIADLYGIGKSTVGKILIEFCDAVVSKLMPKYVKYPENEELGTLAEDFEKKWGSPGVIGSLDGSRIPILTPSSDPIDYFNYKKYHSINLMAGCDANYKFIMANAGQTGRNADSTVFSRTKLHMLFESGKILKPHQDYHLISDAAFYLRSWLMKPFMDNSNTPVYQKHFNYRLSRARMTIENSFGRLKGRWRILLKRIDHNVINCVKIVNACVTLHNICETMSHEYFNDLEDEGLVPTEYFEQPETLNHNSNSSYAELKRESIAKNLKELVV